jgi:hypothetical protein
MVEVRWGCLRQCDINQNYYYLAKRNLFHAKFYFREEETTMKESRYPIWIGRALIGVVFIMNIQSAILFLWQPEKYAPGFQLSSVEGFAAVRGIGLLFLMWNVPYFVALLDPVKHRISLYESLAMQTIGIFGETLIYLTIPSGYVTLQNSIFRFIFFDSFGLGLLLLAFLVTRPFRFLAQVSH